MADIKKIKIDDNEFNIRDAKGSRVYYGTCSTAAATMPKVCNVEEFPTENGLPLIGTEIVVKYSDTNSSTGTPQLNVNNTGAASVWYNNAVITGTKSTYLGYKNRYIRYMWDGNYWVFMGYSYDANSTYDDYSFGLGYGVQNNESASSTITVTLVSYKLKAGPVGVNFIYDVPANSTMNINSVGAKGIYYRGAAITSGIIKAGDLATFIYNKGDSKYHLISIDRWQEDIDDLYSTKADSSSLATVATSGSYNDLLNKPTIPAGVVVDSNITLNGTNPVLGSAIHVALLNKMEHILLIMKNTNGVLTFLDNNQNELTHSLVRLILNDSSKYVNIKYSGVVYEPFYFDFIEDLWMFKQNSMDNEYGISLSFDDEILLDEEYDSSLWSDYLDNYVPTSRKINNKALSSDITLTASDVNANVFIVHIEDGENEGEYTCDKTNAEIYAAWQVGRSIIAMYDSYTYSLASSNITSTYVTFTGHLYDDPHSIDSWIIRVINNSQVIYRTLLYLIDESYPCASITRGNIGSWNNKSTKVIINMSYNSSNNTVSFTDANNTALTHTLVINLLNDPTNDVLIYYKVFLYRAYGLLDGYYYYSGIFEHGTYSYFSLYNNNGTLILDENTFFGVADDNTVVHNTRKVNGKTLSSNIDTIVYGQKSSTGFRVGTYNSTTSTWTYAYSDTTLSVQTIYFDNTTRKAYTYNGKELKEFYSPNLSNFANINGDAGEDFYTKVLKVNDPNSMEIVNISAEYDTNSEIVSLRLIDSVGGESRVLPFNSTQNISATIMTDSDFKTINNLSIIGSGNITINSGSPEAVVDVSVNNADGNLIFTKANGNTITADLNHTHSLYLTAHQSLSGYAKYVLCADETAYNALATKDSGTLYLIPKS